MECGQVIDERPRPHSRRILQVIELAFIAPDIVKAIIRGEQPTGLTAKWLGQNPLPSDWQTQRQVVAAR